MRFGIQILALAISLPLQVLIVAALLRGAWRRFPLLLAFAVVELVSALVQAPGALEAMRGHHAPGLPYWVTYWRGEAITQLLLYAVVITLLYRACERLRSATVARALLIVAACLVAGGSFLLHHSQSSVHGMWMNLWFRDLSFTCVWMDFALFASLLAARDKDRQLLMLSGGLGVEFAGASIGESLREIAKRSMSHSLSQAGGMIMVAASLFRYYTWWQALRRRQPEQKAPAKLQAVRQHSGSVPRGPIEPT